MGASSTPEPVRIPLEANPTPRTVSIGQEITVELEENPTTGYVWKLDIEPENAVVVLETSFLPSRSVPGAGGIRFWRLRVDGGLRVRLIASLHRPWETASAGENPASAILMVRE